MRRLIALTVLAMVLLASSPPAGTLAANYFYTHRVGVSGLDLRSIPAMSLDDGTPVFVFTEAYTTMVGQFQTFVDCEAYVLPPQMVFNIQYLDLQGNLQSRSYVGGTDMTTTDYGCSQRFFQ